MHKHMVFPDIDKWGQTLEDLQRLALRAPHHRTRERFYVLHAILTQERSATALARELGRRPDTTTKWVRIYNESGPDALTYERTGGRPPSPLLPGRTSPS